uniref:Uncharacterized protein n=2 Tax=Rhizobium rhizogenes TaxID=359 RepID=A0A7S5DSP7_RHIRH|nr:hypothetical protein pC5.7b_267 [Rhizobium rhizogenes]QCL09517.1 hypothetical protein pC5.8a_25 [Rhizobium rhizogenes]
MSQSIPVLDASLKVSLPISNSDALLGVDAEWDALDKLYDQTDDANRQIWIQQQISTLKAEHTVLSTKLLHEAWDAYGPSNNIIAAAAALKNLATELDQKAKALDIAATAITAISKFVNAL